MNNGELILFVIKLSLGGIAAFLGIFLWSKTRDSALMTLVAGIVFSYVGTVFEMALRLGIISSGGFPIFGIPIATLIFTIIPSVFFIIAFILLILKNK